MNTKTTKFGHKGLEEIFFVLLVKTLVLFVVKN